MTIREVTMYKVICNGCGADADEGTDYCAWATKDQAESKAEEGDWLVRDDGDWCEDCTVWDEALDERVPKTAAKTGETDD